MQSVAEALGFKQGRGTPPSYGPCPSCGVQQRGRRDLRGPIGLRRDGRGWRCHRCGASGDAADLVGIALEGCRVRDLAPEGHRRMHAWCSGHELSELPPGPEWIDPSETRQRVLSIRPSPELYPRPPASEIAELWKATVPVADDPEVARYLLEERGIDPVRVADFDIARALPPVWRPPDWARCCGRSWSSGWRLILRLWSPYGRLESVHARHIAGGKPKGASPSAFAMAGLVMADDLAKRVLAGDPTARALVAEVGIVVQEGATDFLSRAVLSSDADESAPAVLAIMSGSWSEELAGRIPSGVRMAVRTHDDPAGDRYAEQIAATLAHRCRLIRGGKAALHAR